MNRNDSSSPDRRLPPPTYDQIAALAYALWQDRGRHEGSDVDIWLEAERQLRGERRPDLAADDIPADPAQPTADEDVALQNKVTRKLDDVTRQPDRRSATSL
jgi:hypothetical protein